MGSIQRSVVTMNHLMCILLEINKYEDSSCGIWRRVGREVFEVSEDLLPWSSWSSGVRRTYLLNHSPHTTRRHIPKVLTFHHHYCDNHRPHNIEHSPSLALRTEVRSRNLSNTDQRWRPVDFDYVGTDGDWYRLCMTPYSLEITVRLFLLPLSG
jgi:hypothetical protein